MQPPVQPVTKRKARRLVGGYGNGDPRGLFLRRREAAGGEQQQQRVAQPAQIGVCRGLFRPLGALGLFLSAARLPRDGAGPDANGPGDPDLPGPALAEAGSPTYPRGKLIEEHPKTDDEIAGQTSSLDKRST
jgi:hypothetical protein